MCGCSSNFSGNRPSEIDVDNFSGNRPSEIVVNDDLLSFDGGGSWTDFVDDVESGEKFDNFLTKKSRERRKVRKELEAGGLSKDEAKAKALEQVPKQNLKEILAKLKKGESVVSVQTPAGNVKLSTDPSKALDEVSNALQNTSGSGTSSIDSTDSSVNQAGFLQKNKWLLIGAVVVIGGYFAWKKFGGKN